MENIPVKYIGLQEKPGGGHYVFVNEPAGSTKVFNPQKHEMSVPDLHKLKNDVQIKINWKFINGD